MQANDKTETMLDAMQGETTAADVPTADEAMENRSLLFETEPETGDGEDDNAPVRPKRVRKKPVTRRHSGAGTAFQKRIRTQHSCG